MDGYISREAANKAVCELCGTSEGTFCVRCDRNPLQATPAADVVEMRHGRWIQRGRKIYCSKCNLGVYIGTDDEGLMQDEMRLLQFCPGCGAKMDGGNKDEKIDEP